jgi:hypothetical protein
MFHIAFYVPEDAAEKVKEAMFTAGAGKIGNYQRCSFEYPGIGQFEPLPKSQPYIGSVGKLERVKEIKVEMVCLPEFLKASVFALRANHPYETPAYYVTETVRV